jgi:hypothetical protein
MRSLMTIESPVAKETQEEAVIKQPLKEKHQYSDAER